MRSVRLAGELVKARELTSYSNRHFTTSRSIWNVLATHEARQRLREMGCDPFDLNELDAHVFKYTGRLTRYTETTDFQKLFANADGDVDLRNHVTRVLRMYQEHNNRNLDTRLVDILDDSIFESYILDYMEWVRVDNYVLAAEDCSTCHSCGDMFPTADMSVVHTDEDNEDIFDYYCESCANSDSDVLSCELTRNLYDTRCVSFVETEDGCYCARQPNLDSGAIVEDEDDDGDPIYYRANAPRRSRSLLPDYHGAERPWQYEPIPPRAIGVELELSFDNKEQREAYIREHVTPSGLHKGELPFSFERDGSLDELPAGMEVISAPMVFHEGYVAKNAPWRAMLKELYTNGARAWKYRTKAGIHVNMDVRHVSQIDVLKYAVFISNAAALSKFISGRKAIYGGHDNSPAELKRTMYSGGYSSFSVERHGPRHGASWSGPKTSDHAIDLQRMLTTGPADAQEQVFGHGKYSPVFRRRSGLCLETRIFGANLKYEGFMACVEYCVAVMDYVQGIDAYAVFSPTLSPEFRQWLHGKIRKYPNLTARLGISETNGKIVPLLAAA